MPDKYGFQIYGLEIFPKLILLDHTNWEEINTKVIIKTNFTVDSKQNKSIKNIMYRAIYSSFYIQ